MEDDFGTHVIQLARNCGTNYRCIFGEGNCSATFHMEEEMVQHLRRAELDGGHETEILNRYNLINGILARARPPATSYNEEASIGRATSKEVFSNSEGEGDDPMCISSAEKGKARAMELTPSTGPPSKRPRYLENVVEESTVVAYGMKEHIPIEEEEEKEEEDVPKVASNSEGEGDDPLCISSAEKGKARAMELTPSTGPPSKRPRYLENVVEESTVVAYGMREHIPIAEEKEKGEEDVPKVASNSEGKGDDPLCISSAEKGKARAMEMTPSTGPPSNWPRNHMIFHKACQVCAYIWKSIFPNYE